MIITLQTHLAIGKKLLNKAKLSSNALSFYSSTMPEFCGDLGYKLLLKNRKSYLNLLAKLKQILT